MANLSMKVRDNLTKLVTKANVVRNNRERLYESQESRVHFLICQGVMYDRLQKEAGLMVIKRSELAGVITACDALATLQRKLAHRKKSPNPQADIKENISSLILVLGVIIDDLPEIQEFLVQLTGLVEDGTLSYLLEEKIKKIKDHPGRGPLDIKKETLMKALYDLHQQKCHVLQHLTGFAQFLDKSPSVDKPHALKDIQAEIHSNKNEKGDDQQSLAQKEKPDRGKFTEKLVLIKAGKESFLIALDSEISKYQQKLQKLNAGRTKHENRLSSECARTLRAYISRLEAHLKDLNSFRADSMTKIDDTVMHIENGEELVGIVDTLFPTIPPLPTMKDIIPREYLTAPNRTSAMGQRAMSISVPSNLSSLHGSSIKSTSGPSSDIEDKVSTVGQRSARILSSSQESKGNSKVQVSTKVHDTLKKKYPDVLMGSRSKGCNIEQDSSSEDSAFNAMQFESESTCSFQSKEIWTPRSHSYGSSDDSGSA